MSSDYTLNDNLQNKILRWKNIYFITIKILILKSKGIIIWNLFLSCYKNLIKFFSAKWEAIYFINKIFSESELTAAGLAELTLDDL